MTSILVADDHALVRNLVSSYITNARDYHVTQASSYGEVRELIDTRGAFDLILLDYDMPDANGLDGVIEVIQMNSAKPVALLSGAVSRNVTESALRHGAAGIIPKTMQLRSMIAAIDFIIAGEIYAPVEYVLTSEATGKARLTERETEVLMGLYRGLSNKEIARELTLHETTIKMHVRRIAIKLNAKNRTHAVMLAIEQRLIGA